MKKYVIILSKTFPKSHSMTGKETYFKEQVLNVLKGYDGCIIEQHNGEPLFINGRKIHTIRENYALWEKCIGEVNRGEACISLREWSGKPYRSQQREIAVLTANDGIGIQRVIMSESEWEEEDGRHFCYWAEVDGKEINLDEIAKNDGFSDTGDYIAWFSPDIDRQSPDKDGWKHVEFAIIHFTKFRY